MNQKDDYTYCKEALNNIRQGTKEWWEDKK